MTPEADRMFKVLLAHRNDVVAKHSPAKTPPKGDSDLKLYTLAYAQLCERAHMPNTPQVLTKFLGEIAEHCAARKWPLLNALAVGSSGIPGDKYEGPGGGSLQTWPAEVRASLHCDYRV